MIVEKLFASSDGGNSAKEVVTEGNAWDVLTGLFNREGRKKLEWTMQTFLMIFMRV